MRYGVLFPALLLSICDLSGVSHRLRADDIVEEDFESGTYDGWSLEGNAFGSEPAEGTLPNQMGVSGFLGQRLVNTFRGGDSAKGTATSAAFELQRSHVAFLIGGGAHVDRTCVELWVGGKRVRSATGSESEELTWASWDVSEFRGRKARFKIVDAESGGWGHINVDHIMQTDLPPKRFNLEPKLAEYRATAGYMNEPLRPQVHFSPEINWMNDPNVLVYHRGEYHLFYQFNPAGNSWGHMSWGHAVSRDLVYWTHLPLAIPEENGIMAFCGCCVVDRRNTSGFGTDENPAMVAIYTGHGRGRQVQNLAYSLDDGRTWTKYDGNPVLDIQNPDFRDPKVFWHKPSQRWVMVVSLAASDHHNSVRTGKTETCSLFVFRHRAR